VDNQLNKFHHRTVVKLYIKKMKIRHIALLPILLFSACTPKTDFDIADFDKKLVIWAYLKADEVVEINVSRTTSPLDNTQDRKVPDATVLLYENDLLVDTLKHTEVGNYRSEAGIVPMEGNSYQIQIQYENYPTLITSKDTVLSKPDVLSYDLNIETGSTSSADYNAELVIQVSTEQAYIANKIEDVPFDIFTNWRNHTLTCSQDGFFGYLFDFNDYLGVDYSCLNNPVSVFFSEKYQGNLPESIEVSLCHIPQNAANYHQKIADAELYTDDQTIDIFIEPVYLPQIVENGYGYFGTYSCTKLYIEL